MPTTCIISSPFLDQSESNFFSCIRLGWLWSLIYAFTPCHLFVLQWWATKISCLYAFLCKLGCSDIWPNNNLSFLISTEKAFVTLCFSQPRHFPFIVPTKLFDYMQFFLLLLMVIKIQEYLDFMKLFHYLFYIITDGYQLTACLLDFSGYYPA